MDRGFFWEIYIDNTDILIHVPCLILSSYKFNNQVPLILLEVNYLSICQSKAKELLARN